MGSFSVAIDFLIADIRQDHSKMTQSKKIEKENNLRKGEEDLEILVAWDYRVEQLSEYHFRINERLNVWPSTKKFYDANSQKKGKYETLSGLVKEFPSL